MRWHLPFLHTCCRSHPSTPFASRVHASPAATAPTAVHAKVPVPLLGVIQEQRWSSPHPKSFIGLQSKLPKPASTGTTGLASSPASCYGEASSDASAFALASMPLASALASATVFEASRSALASL